MKFKRILLKLSGESLSGQQAHGLSKEVLSAYAKEIAQVASGYCQIAIVIGGGNIFRGVSGSRSGIDRVSGDQMGMLATVINSLALESELKSQGAKAKLFTSIRMEPVGELYSRNKVIEAMESGNICLIAGGTGNPFFTTDTAAVLRAVEIEADVLLKGTRVDGVYDSDPEKNSNAVRFDTLTIEDAINKQLGVMDQTAFTLCRENGMPIVVFDMNTAGNLKDIVSGQNRGTLISIK